ncbi:hypothetical protein [Thermoleptolyngbya sp.]
MLRGRFTRQASKLICGASYLVIFIGAIAHPDGFTEFLGRSPCSP